MDNKTFNAVYEAISATNKKADICKQYDITRSKLDWNLNLFLKETEWTKQIRHQMFLGAILGDGYFQKTKGGVYKYRESHSVNELEYAKWKYLILQSYHKNTRIISKNDNTACEVYTTKSCSAQIKPYVLMTKSEAIQQLNIYGLLFYLLDEGWCHSKGNFIIGSTLLDNQQKQEIISKLNDYQISAQLIGKRQDISIDSHAGIVLLAYLIQIAPTLDMDIIKKKFGLIITRGIV